MISRIGQSRFGILGFLAVTLVVLAALVLFARYPALFRHGRQYRALFRNVAGLNPGDDVRYGGLAVGTVTDLAISKTDPTMLVVVFRVRRDTPVRVDTRASITQVGLLGAPYLQLAPGSPTARVLAEGGTLPSAPNLSFQEAMTRLAVFFDRADTLLAGAQRIASASPLERVNHTLDRVDSLVTVATVGSNKVLGQMDRATAHLDDLMDRSSRLVAQLDTAIQHSAPELRTTEEQALQSVQELHGLLAEMRDALNEGGGVGQVVRDMSITAENLARVSERLDRDPASLLKRRATPAKVAGPKVQE